ncbi:hypothetical protein MKW94_017076, partial [Papaver nudicaule]|nr:hypothetical protein [Papaver nudicaule]
VSIMDLSQASGNLSEEEVNPSQVESELTTNAVVDGTPSTNAAVKPKRKLKSDVWAGYEHVWEPAENNPERMVCWAKCLLCGEKKTTGPNSGTSNLRRHRISCSKRHQLICNVFLNL